MFVASVRRFLDYWAESEGVERLFVLWSGANTTVAFGLLLGAFGVLVATNAPGFQRGVLLAYVVVAVAWLISIFAIGPVYDRVVPPEE